MPLTKKGTTILSHMMEHYKKNGKSKKEIEGIFYAARNKGTITGVDRMH